MQTTTISPTSAGSMRRGTLEEISLSATLADAEQARRAGAVVHEAIAYRFKAHPRFFAAAAFVWPSATWSFGRG